VVSAATAGTDYLTTSYAGTSSIVTVGTITSGTWTGTTIAVANGGTGQTTAANAINALLPTQTSHSGQFLTTNGTVASWGSPAGAGTVTTVSVASANGLAGTVANPTSTPAITLSTTVTGIVKGDGTRDLGGDGRHRLRDPAHPDGRQDDRLFRRGGRLRAVRLDVGRVRRHPADRAGRQDADRRQARHPGRHQQRHRDHGRVRRLQQGGDHDAQPDQLVSRGVVVQYKASTAIWYVISRDVGAILYADKVTAPGSTGQLVYNSSGRPDRGADFAIGSSGQLVGTAISDPGSPAAGDLWYSSTRPSWTIIRAGNPARLGGTIWQLTSAATAVANTTTETSVLAGGTSVGSLTIPANSLSVGDIIHFRYHGTWGCTATPTFQVGLYLGATKFAGGKVTASATTTGAMWYDLYRMEYHVQAIGASGKIIGSGGTLANLSGTASTQVGVPSGGTGTTGGYTAPVQVTIDTTASLAFDFKRPVGHGQRRQHRPVPARWIDLNGA
jgi:hypothetical protein